MEINSIKKQQTFEGSVILKNKISTQQNSLFKKHKPNLDQMIKDMPFDLFVEQSKSKKTISLSTNVEGTSAYFVRKNEQNFEEAAGYAISEAKQKSPAYKKMVVANEILNYTKLGMIHVISGNYKEARESHKQLAKLAIKNFETYKQVTNFKITDLPHELGAVLLVRSLKFKLYYALSQKTPEEKQLKKMNKEYLKTHKNQKINKIPFQQQY